jgi:hypothetical protein
MVWTVIAAAGVLCWLVLGVHLLRILRRDHPDVYEALGSPGLLLNNTPSNSWAFLKFLFSSEARRLANPRLLRLCLTGRVLFVLLAAWLSIPFLIVVYFQLLHLVVWMFGTK